MMRVQTERVRFQICSRSGVNKYSYGRWFLDVRFAQTFLIFVEVWEGGGGAVTEE